MSVEVVSGEVVLGVVDARRLTDEAKASAVALRNALVELYEGDAHIALGYDSWGEYCATEFGLSERNAWDILDHGRVVRAIESGRAEAQPELPNQKVARTTLAKLLPPTNAQSARTGRNGSDEQVAAAWDKVVEAKAQSNDADGPITAGFAKKVLVKSGDLPDTTGASGKAGWHELLGEVGDTLVKADKQLVKVEGELSRKPSADFGERAERYATWADELATRLRKLKDGPA